ncbi:MAG: hypothetical protein AAF761_05495 [Pseudomonadota bacterium]
MQSHFSARRTVISSALFFAAFVVMSLLLDLPSPDATLSQILSRALWITVLYALLTNSIRYVLGAFRGDGP